MEVAAVPGYSEGKEEAWEGYWERTCPEQDDSETQKRSKLDALVEASPPPLPLSKKGLRVPEDQVHGHSHISQSQAPGLDVVSRSGHEATWFGRPFP